MLHLIPMLFLFTLGIKTNVIIIQNNSYLGCVKRIWYLSPMRAAKVQASLRIRAVSPEPSLLAHTSSESRGTFRQKARSLVHLNGWACAVKICHDGMLEDTNSLDAAHFTSQYSLFTYDNDLPFLQGFNLFCHFLAFFFRYRIWWRKLSVTSDVSNIFQRNLYLAK